MARALMAVVSRVGSVVKGSVGKLGQKVASAAVKNGARNAALKTALSTAKKAAFQIATAAAVNAVFAPSLNGAGGRPVQFTADPNAPIPLVIGRAASGGEIVARMLSGPGGGNKFETFFGVLSFAGDAGAIEAIEAFKANEYELEFHPTTHKPSEGGYVFYQDVMHQWTQLGAVGDPAFTDFEFTPADWTTL